MEKIFIAGTGTEIGKTYVASRLAEAMVSKGRRVGVYKPVASDCTPDVESGELVSDDAVSLWQAAGKPLSLKQVCPQRFTAPLAPDEAARREGTTVDEDLLVRGAVQWEDYAEVLIVEGAGGLFSPIADSMLNVDLFKKLDCQKLFLVAPNRLGVIHDVVATLRAAEGERVAVDRVYLSTNRETIVQPDPSCSTNAEQILRWCPSVEITEVAWGQAIEMA